MNKAFVLGNRRRGATTVEMAVVAPVFFLLVFGLVEFGRMTMVQEALANAARMGCRKAALASTNNATDAEATLRAQLRADISNSADVNTCRVTISPANLTGLASGTDVTAAVEVDFTDISWIPPTFLGSVVLRREATMKRE